MTFDKLERGKLYQVRFRHAWIIAEYVSRQEAYTARGFSVSSDFRHIGKEKTWPQPASHYWNGVKGTGMGGFRVHEKEMEVRPLSDDAIQQIVDLQGELNRIDEQRRGTAKQLRELCS